MCALVHVCVPVRVHWCVHAIFIMISVKGAASNMPQIRRLTMKNCALGEGWLWGSRGSAEIILAARRAVLKLLRLLASFPLIVCTEFRVNYFYKSFPCCPLHSDSVAKWLGDKVTSEYILLIILLDFPHHLRDGFVHVSSSPL